MAEASVYAYVYVIITGLIFGITLFVLRGDPIRFTFNTKFKTKKVMPLPRSTLLKFNATIIAGLFIFLTIQSASTDNGTFIFMNYLTSQEIKKEYEKIINNTDNDPLLIDEAKKRVVEIELDSIQNLEQTVSNSERKWYILLIQPFSYFTLSLGLMTLSSLAVLVSNEGSRGVRLGEGAIIFALMSILIGVYLRIVL